LNTVRPFKTENFNKQAMKIKALTIITAGLLAFSSGLSAQSTTAAKADKAEATVNRGEVVPLITFDETPLTDVITTLARQAAINFQFDPRVNTAQTGPDGKPLPPATISIRFENVTALDALEAVLDNHNLQLVANEKTKIGRVTIKDPKALEPLVSQMFQLRYTSPTNIVPAVQNLLTDTRGKVMADSRSGKVLVSAVDRDLKNIEKVITELDTATKQVLIEARIVETARNPSSIKGIDWGGTLRAQNFTFGNGITAGTTTTSFPGATTTTSTPLPSGAVITSTSSAASTSTTSLNTTVGGCGFSVNTKNGVFPGVGFLNADGVSGVLSFFNDDSDSDVVSTPRTVTMDNQLATLSVTRAFPIFTVTPGSANTPAAAQITYTNVGTILQVTPRITADSNIFLHVVPEVSNIDGKDTQTISSATFQANVYALRRMETQVLIPSGNTLVMGGLTSDTSTKSYAKIPGLGDAPGIGRLFRRDSKSRSKVNLIIFVTPTIVQEYDYHYTPTDYLRNTLQDQNVPKTWVAPGDNEESPWDTGKPKDWKKDSKTSK
jgi:type II secretory pathway component GspD/PulD (secretin)